MKERLDLLLVKRGLCESRSRARAVIMEGAVFVNNEREDKPGSLFDRGADIQVKSNPIPFVSRGGLKLQKAIREFNIDLRDKIVMDIGASTGGFTDCMLQCGAGHVYSIDVGYGQLAYKLRTDSRVTVMERTNIRKVSPGDIQEKPEFASVDVSFISLRLVLPAAEKLLTADHSIVALIKPQFEAGKEEVGKSGVVREANIHRRVIKEIRDFAVELGYSVGGITYSPIRGPKGNIEYLIYLCHDGTRGCDVKDEYIRGLVEISHNGT